MKDKILYLVLGILIGAVITAAGFLVVSRIIGSRTFGNSSSQSFDRGDMPSMSDNGNFTMPDGMDASHMKGNKDASNTTDTTTTATTTNEVSSAE